MWLFLVEEPIETNGLWDKFKCIDHDSLKYSWEETYNPEHTSRHTNWKLYWTHCDWKLPPLFDDSTVKSTYLCSKIMSSSRGGRFKSQDGKFSFQFAYCYYVFWYLFLFLLQWMLIIVCFIYCSCFEVNIIYCLLICYTDMLFLLFLHPRTCSWWVEIFPLVFLICIHI